LVVASLLVLAAQLPLWGYDTEPNFIKIIPEAIWAAATGGGTWVTELQITNLGPVTSPINVSFYYGTAVVRGAQVHPGLAQFDSVRFSNILATLEALDTGGFIYYGRVGSLKVFSENLECRLQVQARIVNGNFGKSMPGIRPVAGATAAQGRPMVIQDIVKSSTYRTSVGLFNTSGDYTYVVIMTIYDANHTQVGSPFMKTLIPVSFTSFNPFAQAGATAGNYENCWLAIDVLSGGSNTEGVACYGSVANSYTNDTFALLPVMFQVQAPGNSAEGGALPVTSARGRP
jgi:hypothetical protein